MLFATTVFGQLSLTISAPIVDVPEIWQLATVLNDDAAMPMPIELADDAVEFVMRLELALVVMSMPMLPLEVPAELEMLLLELPSRRIPRLELEAPRQLERVLVFELE